MYPITTVTLNPCIDKSTKIPLLVPEKKMRCSVPIFEPGGGGINVARVLNRFGCKALAIYPAGGYSGKFLSQLLSKEDIPSNCIETASHTRENLIVFEESSGKQYRFGMPGAALQKVELLHCLKAIEESQSEFIVVSGSLATMQAQDAIAIIANRAKQQNKKLVIDTSGPSIKVALEVGVFMIKPNLGELSVLLDKEATIASAGTLAKEIVEKGQAQNVIVSLGKAGALLITKELHIHFTPPAVKTISTVGAGDSMVAGILYKLVNGWTMADACKYGVACGTAATMNPGTELCHKSDAELLFAKVKVNNNVAQY